MKYVITFLIALVSFTNFAQSNYEKGMQNAFQLMETEKLTEAANLFERIANAEQENWLPSYWAAYLHIMNSFGEKDKEKLTAQLKKAQDLVNDATAISKDNPEIMVIQALLHTAWIAYDGQTYGMKLSGPVMQLYGKAQQCSLELFANFKPETAFHPNWGKDHAEDVLKTCN